MPRKNSTLRKMDIGGRPRSSSLKIFKENRNAEYNTSYVADYGTKPFSKRECIRAGTASGSRKNNPHPPMTFMVWRLPSNPPPHILRRCSIESPPPIPIDNIISNERLSSTYMEDYRGLREQPRPPSYLEHYRNNTKTTTKCSKMLSTSQRAYQLPRMTDNLRGFTTRYECNKDVVKGAKGILPTVNEASPHCLMGIKHSQYMSDFGEDISNLKLPKMHPKDCAGLVANSSTTHQLVRFNSKDKTVRFPQLSKNFA